MSNYYKNKKKYIIDGQISYYKNKILQNSLNVSKDYNFDINELKEFLKTENDNYFFFNNKLYSMTKILRRRISAYIIDVESTPKFEKGKFIVEF